MKFKEYYEKFEKMQNFIISDLRRSSIYGKANFLVAMGLFNYFEIIGAFYEYKERKSSCTKRFNFVFTDLLSEKYHSFYKELKKITEPYDCLRCGMTHEYFIKTYNRKNKKIEISYTIFNPDDEHGYNQNIMDKNCGLELIIIGSDKYHINVYNPRFIYDFNLAIEKLKNKIATNQSDYRDRFFKRSEDIVLSEFS
jgi:hypothetical protein